MLLYNVGHIQIDSHHLGNAGNDPFMVTNFALSLSFDGIALLRRTGDVWANIQEVPLDSGDLDAAVLGLRNRAEGLDPSGAQVTLIIPNEQIRYLKIPDPGGNSAAQDLAVRTSLDGATPYPVSDLVYDFVVSKGDLLIAAVAKETLGEAEAFAQQNGFEPVAHAAQAPRGQFDGAVFFGATTSWSGQSPERLSQAIEIVPADAIALEPVVVPADVEPDVEPEAAAPAPEADQVPELEPDPAPASEPKDAPQAELDLTAPVKEDVPPAEPVADAPQAAPSDAPETAADPKPVSEEAKPEAYAQDAELTGSKTAPQEKPTKGKTQTEQAATADKDAATPDDAPPMAFSTIRAARGASDQSPPGAPKGQDTAKEPPTAQIKPRFTPVATPAPRVQDAAVTAPRMDDTPPPTAKKPAKAPTKPAAPSVARPKAAGPAPSVKPAPAMAPKTGTAPPAEVSKSALARLAALRARTEPVPGDAKAPPTPELKAGNSKPAQGLPIPPKAAQTPVQVETVADVPAAQAPVAKPQPEGAQPTGKSPLGRLAALRPKPKQDSAEESAAVAAAAAASLTAQTERDRMTVFGARNQPEVGGKPRFLGLLLTAGLLLFMAGVAAWASVFLDDGLAGLFRSKPNETAIAAAPDIAPEPVLETVEPAAKVAEEPAQEVQLAALDSGLTSDPDGEVVADAPAPRSVPLEPRMLSPEEAAATYAATGIWQRAPVAPLGITTDGVDDVYVASIDPKVQESDAVALPDAARFEQDPAIEEPRLPPAAGQVFDMDARGLVRATPEGAMSPDGIRVFTGLPPAVPPLRSALVAPQQTPAPEANETLRNLRPKLRPNNLIEERERATLSGRSRAELASLRPVMRPKTAQEVAVAEEPEAVATAQAVSASLVPVSRPRNMEAIVKRVERTAPEAAVQTAAIAPRTVTPAAPSSRGVSQSATVRNAINLNKISLIGVYGTPAQRRALVRLPNGKYQKVKVGDRLDGGRVAAIGDAELRYTKSGRNVSLKMPRG